MKIENPYKIAGVETKEICFDASRQDFHELKSRLPRHGAIDASVSLLFSRFISQLRTLVPVAQSSQEADENEHMIHSAITNLTLNV